MSRNRRSQQVETDDVVVEIRVKIGRDGFRDLERRKLDAALPHRFADKGASPDLQTVVVP